MTTLPHARLAKVTEIQDEQVELLFDDGQKILWPRELLKEDIALEEDVHVLVFGEREGEKERERLARHVLGEMLKGNE